MIYQADLLELPLVKHFYQVSGIKIKPERDERIFILRSSEPSESRVIIAAVRFLLRPDNCYLIRHLYVQPESRKQGLASQLLQTARALLHHPCCYCYVFPRLQSFYESLDFRCLTAQVAAQTLPLGVPTAIVADYQRYQRNRPELLFMGFTVELCKAAPIDYE